jgi:hypothetical protein
LRLVFDEQSEKWGWEENDPTLLIIRQTEERLKMAIENIVD